MQVLFVGAGALSIGGLRGATDWIQDDDGGSGGARQGEDRDGYEGGDSGIHGTQVRQEPLRGLT